MYLSFIIFLRIFSKHLYYKKYNFLSHNQSPGAFFFISFFSHQKPYIYSGRGCGGRMFNTEGIVTSPMYPLTYRKSTICRWDIAVPRPYPVIIMFKCSYNLYTIYKNFFFIKHESYVILTILQKKKKS